MVPAEKVPEKVVFHSKVDVQKPLTPQLKVVPAKAIATVASSSNANFLVEFWVSSGDLQSRKKIVFEVGSTTQTLSAIATKHS